MGTSVHDELYDLKKWIAEEALFLGVDISMILRNPTHIENDLVKIMTAIKKWNQEKEKT